jgi:hypothetical protein
LNRSFECNIGLRVFYTSHLREHDAGFFWAGILAHYDRYDPEKEMVVLPGFEEFTKTNTFSLGKSIKPEGITVFADNLHMHGLGRKSRVEFHSIARNSTEEVVRDDHFDTNRHDIRKLDEKFQVFPNDELVQTCVLDTTSLKNVTRNQACGVWYYYYPINDFLNRPKPANISDFEYSVNFCCT